MGIKEIKTHRQQNNEARYTPDIDTAAHNVMIHSQRRKCGRSKDIIPVTVLFCFILHWVFSIFSGKVCDDAATRARV